MKLLLVEDDQEIVRAVSQVLSGIYVLETASTGKDALAKTAANDYDLVILDLGLPDITGLEVCKKLRALGHKIPILILTGVFQSAEDVVIGLDGGADDYLAKPFDAAELLARLRALLRRNPTSLTNDKITVSDLTLDLAARKAQRANSELTLRRKEYDLLEYLARNPNRVLTRQMIFDHVWDSDANMFNNTVDVHIKYLRDKVDRPYARKMIKTVHGLGYKLEIEKGGE